MPPVSTVAQVTSELNATGTGPYTIYDVAGITSGQVYDKITEADAYLRRWVGDGPSDSALTVVQEQVRRFETNYASARILMQIAGIITTDGFNYSLAGIDVARVGSKLETYKMEIEKRMALAKWYIVALHDWFIVFNPTFAQGYSETGLPIQYWNVSSPRGV